MALIIGCIIGGLVIAFVLGVSIMEILCGIDEITKRNHRDDYATINYDTMRTLD